MPYVGADYPAGVSALVQLATGLGHTHLAYLGEGSGPESYADRMRGFTDAVTAAGASGHHAPAADLARAFDSLLAAGTTALFVEEYADAVALLGLAAERGLRIPADLSILTLGDPTRPTSQPEVELTGFRIPRRQMGAQAVDVLMALLEGDTKDSQRLLGCELVAGATLAPPRD